MPSSAPSSTDEDADDEIVSDILDTMQEACEVLLEGLMITDTVRNSAAVARSQLKSALTKLDEFLGPN